MKKWLLILILIMVPVIAFGAELQVPVRIPSDADIVFTGDCSNNPGPFITLTGEIEMKGLIGRLIFRNNVQGTHEHVEDITVDVVILPAGQVIQFSKQPPLGGVGGNPRIYFQFLSGAGIPLTSEFYLGKCVQLGD